MTAAITGVSFGQWVGVVTRKTLGEIGYIAIGSIGCGLALARPGVAGIQSPRASAKAIAFIVSRRRVVVVTEGTGRLIIDIATFPVRHRFKNTGQDRAIKGVSDTDSTLIADVVSGEIVVVITFES